MRRVLLDELPAQAIESFGSSGFGALAHAGRARVTVCRVDAGGVIGAHEAPVAQLFVVVCGQAATTCGDDRIELVSGDAVFFEVGDDHETRTSTGFTAVVMESPELCGQF